MSSVSSSITLSSAKQAKVHSLPCTIHLDGDANVDEYFTPFVQTSANTSTSVAAPLKGTIRGRPINGKNITLPPNTLGFVITTKEADLDEEQKEQKQFVTERTFAEMTNWKLDENPDSEVEINGSITWMQVSQLIHKPVE